MNSTRAMQTLRAVVWTINVVAMMAGGDAGADAGASTAATVGAACAMRVQQSSADLTPAHRPCMLAQQVIAVADDR